MMYGRCSKSTCLKMIRDLFNHSAIAELLVVSKSIIISTTLVNISVHKLLSMLTFLLDKLVSGISTILNQRG